jgi:hypothetical protein
LQKITEAAANLGSYADAAWSVRAGGIPISDRQLERIAVEIGTQMAQQRDKKAERPRQVPVRVPTPPQAVAVEVDGGRLRTRAADSGRGVHDAQNKEDKIACLINIKNAEEHEQDPQPEPPESFQEPRRVQRLVQEMKGLSGDKPQEELPQENTPKAPPPEAEFTGEQKEEVRVRTCVASMADSEQFGKLVAAEARERGFYQANRRAFVADGASYNWTLQKKHFADFEPIADFLHVLCYIYLAAYAVGEDEAKKWAIYLGWLNKCWKGKVSEVIAELENWQTRIGKPPEGQEVEKKDPRRLVAEALSYLRNNQERMKYPGYRKRGLPITSSLAESLVGEFNARVKARNKFWECPGGAEAILQLRAAALSEDGRMERFFQTRTTSPFRPYAKAA